MNWFKTLSWRQQLIIVLTIAIFGARYGLLDFMVNRPSWNMFVLIWTLFPETFFVPAVLEPKGWSETIIAFWMYVAMLLTSYLCSLLILALCANRSTDAAEEDEEAAST